MMKATLLILLFSINGYQAKKYECSPDDPVYVWPLSFGTDITEIMTNTSEGEIGTITYEIGAIDHGIKSAIGFTGETNSSVTLVVPEHDVFLDDYTILFYLYVTDTSTGTLLQYISDLNSQLDDIEQFKVSILNGNILVDIVDYGSVTFLTNIRAGVWNNLMLERDFSKDSIKLYMNRIEFAELTVNDQLYDKPTNSPGTLFLGSDIYGTNRFTGSISCLQIIPCKIAIDLKYDSYCRTDNITRSSNTVPTSTESTNIATGFTFTTTATPVTSIPPSTPGSTTATSADAWPSFMTGSVPNTTESTKITTESTFTTAATTVTSILPSTPGSTIATSAYSLTIQNFAIEEHCSHFTLMSENATFGNPLDVIASTVVSDIGACVRICNIYSACFSFSILPIAEEYQCKIGPRLPSV